MTAPAQDGKGAAVTVLAAALLFAAPAPAAAGVGAPSSGPYAAETDEPEAARPGWARGESLRLRVALRPTLLDYELPGHPRRLGVGHVGVVGDAVLDWTLHPRVTLGVGVRGRLPFAFDLGQEAGALPIVYLALQPLDSRISSSHASACSEPDASIASSSSSMRLWR